MRLGLEMKEGLLLLWLSRGTTENFRCESGEDDTCCMRLLLRIRRRSHVVFYFRCGGEALECVGSSRYCGGCGGDLE